jgi:prevent-host-death family protein
MREIEASEAQTRLPQILDEVERGETFVISRDGRAIARLVPDVQCRQAEIDQAIAELGELRRRAGKTTLAELLAARHAMPLATLDTSWAETARRENIPLMGRETA